MTLPSPCPRRSAAVRMLLTSSCPGSSADRAPVATMSPSTDPTHNRMPVRCSAATSRAWTLSAGEVATMSSRCAWRNASSHGSPKSAGAMTRVMAAR